MTVQPRGWASWQRNTCIVLLVTFLFGSFCVFTFHDHYPSDSFFTGGYTYVDRRVSEAVFLEADGNFQQNITIDADVFTLTGRWEWVNERFIRLDPFYLLKRDNSGNPINPPEWTETAGAWRHYGGKLRIYDSANPLLRQTNK